MLGLPVPSTRAPSVPPSPASDVARVSGSWTGGRVLKPNNFKGQSWDGNGSEATASVQVHAFPVIL